MVAQRRDIPFPSFNFIVELIGVCDDGNSATCGFTECTGLGVELTPIEYRNGNEDITVKKIPGLKKFENIVLKRGMTGDLNFWNWMVEGMEGQVRRTDGTIIMQDENQQEVLRWNFKNAWPCKFTGPGYNAANNEVAMETLEICHEGLEIDGQG